AASRVCAVSTKRGLPSPRNLRMQKGRPNQTPNGTNYRGQWGHYAMSLMCWVRATCKSTIATVKWTGSPNSEVPGEAMSKEPQVYRCQNLDYFSSRLLNYPVIDTSSSCRSRRRCEVLHFASSAVSGTPCQTFGYFLHN